MEETLREESPLSSVSALLWDATGGAEHPRSTTSITVRVHISKYLELIVAVSQGCLGEGDVLESLVKPAQV